MKIFNKSEKNQIINTEELEKNKAYFCNYECYDSEKKFLKELIDIITDKKMDSDWVTEDSDFEMCINYLVEKGYLVLKDKNDDLIDLLNNSFKISLDKRKVNERLKENRTKIKTDEKALLIEKIIIEQLEQQGYGLVYIYSIGDFYSYGIVTLEKIEKLKKHFEPLFNDYYS